MAAGATAVVARVEVKAEVLVVARAAAALERGPTCQTRSTGRK